MPAAWFWLYPWLDALSRGDVVRRATSVVLRVAGWVALAFGAIAVLAILRLAFTSELPARAILGALVLGVVIAGAAAAMHQVFLYHVHDVERLSDARFVMIPIVAVLARMGGELFAVWWAAVGIGGFLVLLLAGSSAGLVSGAAAVIPGMPSLPFTGWLGMIWFLLWCGVVGIIGLLLAYLWAEGLTVVVDIANRLHAMATPGPAPAPTASADAPVLASAPPQSSTVRLPTPVPTPPPPPPAPRPTPVPLERPTPVPMPVASPALPPRPTPVPAPPTQLVTPASAPQTASAPLTASAPPTQIVPAAPAAPPPQTYAERGEGGPSTVILGPPRKCNACGATTTLVMAKFCEECGARL